MTTKETLCYFKLKGMAKNMNITQKPTMLKLTLCISNTKELTDIITSLTNEGLLVENKLDNGKLNYTLLKHDWLTLTQPDFLEDDSVTEGDKKIASSIYTNLDKWVVGVTPEEIADLIGVSVTVVEAFNRRLKEYPLAINKQTSITHIKFPRRVVEKVTPLSKIELVTENTELKARVVSLEQRIIELEKELVRRDEQKTVEIKVLTDLLKELSATFKGFSNSLTLS